LKPLSTLLDYTVCSPKGSLNYIKKINPRVNEVRLPVGEGDKLPSLNSLPEAEGYFLSPVFCPDPRMTENNINYCVDMIKQHPEWRLSVQMHKLINIP